MVLLSELRAQGCTCICKYDDVTPIANGTLIRNPHCPVHGDDSER